MGVCVICIEEFVMIVMFVNEVVEDFFIYVGLVGDCSILESIFKF